MKFSLITRAPLALLIASICLLAEPMPMMKSLDPTTGKAGDIITVSGENLDKDTVAKLFLTDGNADFPVDIGEQGATALKFKIPATLKPGRFALVLETKGKEPKQIEQPVKLTIE
jgi:hypothetical protein